MSAINEIFKLGIEGKFGPDFCLRCPSGSYSGKEEVEYLYTWIKGLGLDPDGVVQEVRQVSNGYWEDFRIDPGERRPGFGCCCSLETFALAVETVARRHWIDVNAWMKKVLPDRDWG